MAAGGTPVRGWRSLLFTAVMSLFVVLFITFALLLIAADVLYIDWQAVLTVMTSGFIGHALWMSLWTSATTVALSVLFAIPMGYVLSRYRFPGHVIADSLVDLPIVFPPVVVGLTLLVFFTQTPIGRWIERAGLEFSPRASCSVSWWSRPASRSAQPRARSTKLTAGWRTSR